MHDRHSNPPKPRPPLHMMPSYHPITGQPTNHTHGPHGPSVQPAAAARPPNGQMSPTARNNKPPPPPGAPGERRLNIPSNLFQLDSLQQPSSDQSEQNSTAATEAQTEAESTEPVSKSAAQKQNHEAARSSINNSNTTQFADDVTSTALQHEENTAAVTATPVTMNTSNRHITRVDGKGLWRSWKRNFNSQFTAILDLVDNSLDASIKNIDQGFLGRCFISPDTHTYNDDNNDWDISITTGITIINNCISKPRPLQQCLEVYDSSKVDSGKDSVGENGVGLKQACATLSDSSFVLIKSDEGHGEITCELGIVAEMLQKAEGAYLPAFQFSMKTDDYSNAIADLNNQMHNIFSQPEHEEAATCIAAYGRPLNNNIDSLEFGIQRLCQQFKLCIDSFEDSPYVFAVIVDKIRNDNIEERTGVAGDALTKIHVDNLMKELKSKIPITYLHIPNSFDFRVDGCAVEFKHWQKRLVEFSTFTVDVGTTARFYDPQCLNDQTVSIRVYAGFDAQIMKGNSEKKCCSLYVYSRQSGRLITHHVDARTILGLSAGGTEFCSGLRVIMDDHEGFLPLNPTKQDIAFSEKACGEILKENLYAGVGAFVHTFYKHHVNKFGGKKLVLTKKIQEYTGNTSTANEVLQSELCKLELTTFSIRNTKISSNTFGGVYLRYVGGEEVVGRDTLFRILPDEDAPPLPKSPGVLDFEEKSTDAIDEQPIKHTSKKRKRNSTNSVETTAAAAPAHTHSDYGIWECARCRRKNDHGNNYCIHCGCHQSTFGDNQAGEVQDARNTYNHHDPYYQPGNNSIQQPQVPYHARHWPNSASNTTQQFGYATNPKSRGDQEAYNHHYHRPINNSSRQPQVSHYFDASQHSTGPEAGSAQQFRHANSCNSQEEMRHSLYSNGVSEAHNSSREEVADGSQSQTPDEGHYQKLCTLLTQKLEKVNAKMERRKKENMSLAKQNYTLEQENTVLKSRVEELEKMLGTD